jgi:hypothetical protein
MKKGLIGLGILTLFAFIAIWFVYYRPYDPLDTEIGGYTIYKKPQGLCAAYFEPVIYEDENTIHYTTYSGCREDDYLYIRDGLQFISLKAAIKEGLIDPELLKGHFRTKDKHNKE